MIDEHQPRRRFETRFAPLSVEERSYLEARQAVRDGRIAEHRDALDFQENLALWSAAKVSLAGAAVVATAAMLGLVWVYTKQ